MWGMAASTGVSMLGNLMGGEEEAGGYDEAAKIWKKEGKKARKELRKGFKDLNKGYKRQQEMAQPWMQAGNDMLAAMQAGIAEGTFSPGEFEFNFEDFKNDPSYQFRFDETMRMAEQAGAARGKRLSGQQLKDLQARGGALASEEYGQAFQRGLSTWEANRAEGMDRFNRMANVAGMGQQMTGQMIDAAGQHGRSRAGLRQSIANTRMQQAGGMAPMAVGAGQARGNMYRDLAASANQGIENLQYRSSMRDMSNRYGVN